MIVIAASSSRSHLKATFATANVFLLFLTQYIATVDAFGMVDLRSSPTSTLQSKVKVDGNIGTTAHAACPSPLFLRRPDSTDIPMEYYDENYDDDFNYLPRPPIGPPPSRLLDDMDFDATASRTSSNNWARTSSSAQTSNAFERKSVVMSASSAADNGNAVDMLDMDEIASTLKRASSAATSFLGALSNTATEKMASTKAESNNNKSQERSKYADLITDVPQNTIDGALLAAAGTTFLTTHNPLLSVCAGLASVFAANTKGLPGDIARLVGDATISVGYTSAVCAEAAVNSCIDPLPKSIQSGIVSACTAAEDMMMEAKQSIAKDPAIKKVVEAMPTIKELSFGLMEGLGNAFDIAKTQLEKSIPVEIFEEVEKEFYTKKPVKNTVNDATSQSALIDAYTEQALRASSMTREESVATTNTQREVISNLQMVSNMPDHTDELDFDEEEIRRIMYDEEY